MFKLGTLTLKGASGETYAFEVFAYDSEFNALGAVYAITRRTQKNDDNYKHTLMYLGETGDLSTRYDGHHKKDCFVQHSANCACIHLDDDEDSRLTKEADLLANYNPRCND